MKNRVGKTLFLLVAGGLALTACGGSSSGVTPAPPAQNNPPEIIDADADADADTPDRIQKLRPKGIKKFAHRSTILASRPGDNSVVA
jgi:hypothetical protein